MKATTKHSSTQQSTTQPRQLVSAFILVSILSLSMNMVLMDAVAARESEPSALGLQDKGLIDQGRDRLVNTPNSIPTPTAKAVLQSASQQLKLPTSKLRIVRTEKRTWQDGCLGLARSDEVCTQALVSGYQVTVEGGSRRLVYRTDGSGTVRLDQSVSRKNATKTIKPLPIPQSELPPPLPKGAIFRLIASGGMTGRTSETTLMNDGRVIQVVLNLAGTPSKPQTHQISQQQVQQFHQLLQSLSQFKGLSYPAPSGAADYMTVSLTSQVGTTRYADISSDRLPDPLRQVVRAWSQISTKF